MDITNGGTVSNISCCIANNSGSTGTVTIDGSGSKWINSQGVCAVTPAAGR